MSELTEAPPAAPPAPRAGLGQVAAALQVPGYRWWFLSQVLSASGTMTQGVAMAWLLLELTGRGVYLGLLTAATFGPVLLLGAFAGALVDRSDRRRLLIVTQSLSIVLGVLLAVLAGTGAIEVWMLFVAALAGGCILAVDGPARQVYVLELVGRERTASAVGLYEIVINVSRVLGPATGGVLLATVGASACFAVNAASFVPPLLVLLLAHRRGRVEAHVRRAGSVRAGLAYVRRAPAIRACVLLAAASGMLFNFGVALPLLVTRTFHAGGGVYGALVAVFGVGAIGGALFAAGGAAAPSGRRVRVLAAATGATVLATAAAPELALVFVGLAVAGFFSIWFIALANTLVQIRAEPALRGRVMGVWSMALPGMNPITGIAVGVVAQTAGARVGFGLSGAAILVCAVLAWPALAEPDQVSAPQ
jgi:MFS family permease